MAGPPGGANSARIGPQLGGPCQPPKEGQSGPDWPAHVCNIRKMAHWPHGGHMALLLHANIIFSNVTHMGGPIWARLARGWGPTWPPETRANSGRIGPPFGGQHGPIRARGTRANLAQIGPQLFAPVACPPGSFICLVGRVLACLLGHVYVGLWRRLAMQMPASGGIAWALGSVGLWRHCSGVTSLSLALVSGGIAHGDESPSRNNRPNQPTNHVASRPVSVSVLCCHLRVHHVSQGWRFLTALCAHKELVSDSSSGRTVLIEAVSAH